MSLPNASSTVIANATEADIPALAEVNAHAYLPEAFCPFFFTNSDWPNPAPFISYFAMRAASHFKGPDSETYKIVDAASNEILGFVCTGISEGKERHEGNPAGNFEPPPGFNVEFGMTVAKGLDGLDACMKGTKHMVLTSFAVHPKYQGRGLGTKLLQHCAEIADAARLPIYLNGFPGAHSLYLKLGYVDTGHYDCDLNEWGVKYRGFGVYRTYGMLRQPLLKTDT